MRDVAEDYDPRGGGNYVQPVEHRDGEHSYEVYIGWKLVDTFDDEHDARVCLAGHFQNLIVT